MGRPKDPLLKRYHRLINASEPSFTHGMRTEEGRVKRENWLDILKYLRRVQSVAAGSVQCASVDQEKLLKNAKSRIVGAVRHLVDGDELASHDLNERDTTTQFRVWSSPQNARLAIIQEAIAVAHSRHNAPSTYIDKPPLVILISERYEQSYDKAHETSRRNFLDSWSSTCYGVAEILTIQAESSAKVRESLKHLFDGFSQSDMFPVLMVIYASQTSNITSDMTSIKSACQSWNVRLCFEGPALAMLAQSNRPSDPNYCAFAADVALLDPASWFGFRMCALVTRHKTAADDDAGEFKDQFSWLSAHPSLLKDHDHTSGLATAPILNLWTVLTRIGVGTIRESIDAATILAEVLVSNLKDSPNILTSYQGVGCVVRISYALSKEDRLMSKDKGQDHVSLVNKILISSLQEESETLCIQSNIQPEISWLEFSPVRLLSSGTLWIPPVALIDEYSERLESTVEKYESCRAGSVSFRSCLSKCREIRFLENISQQPELLLSFGAFRVVPTEVIENWDHSETVLETVETLTTLVAKRLTEFPHDVSTPKYINREEADEARALAEESDRDDGRFRPNFLSRAFNMRSSFPYGYDTGGPLPFDVFLHAESDSRFKSFISIEPRERCKAIQAVNQAVVASDLILACVAETIELWRGGEITVGMKSGITKQSSTSGARDRDKAVGNMDVSYTSNKAKSGPATPQYQSDGQHFRGITMTCCSDISGVTRISAEERKPGKTLDDAREVVPGNGRSSLSTSTGSSLLEPPSSPQTALEGHMIGLEDVGAPCPHVLKEIPSTTTIEKSSTDGSAKGVELTYLDWALPTGVESPNQVSCAKSSYTSAPVSSIQSLPVAKAAGGGWFGSWRARRWHKQQGNHDEERDCSTLGERSDGSDSANENEDNSHNEKEEEDQAEDSDPSSDGSGSRDDSSTDENEEKSQSTNHSDNSESEHSSPSNTSSESTTSESTNATSRDEILVGTIEESPSPEPGHTSGLFSWMRRSIPQHSLHKTSPSAKPRRSFESGTSTSSQGDDECRSGRDIHSPEEQEIGYGEKSESFLSDQQSEESALDSSRETFTGSESCESNEISNPNIAETEANRDSRVRPTRRVYGLGWFGRVGEQSQEDMERAGKPFHERKNDLASTETESGSEESSSTDEMSRDISRNRQLRNKKHRLARTGDETESTEETEEDSSSNDTSYSSGSRQSVRTNQTTQRQDSGSSSTRNCSSSGDERNLDNMGEGGKSFLDWILPSWATTPPVFRTRTIHTQGVNSRLRSSSPETSTDSESDVSFERKRRATNSSVRRPLRRGPRTQKRSDKNELRRYR